jgi:hypothetical protein
MQRKDLGELGTNHGIKQYDPHPTHINAYVISNYRYRTRK